MAYTHSDSGSRTYQEQNQRGSQTGPGDKQNTSVVIKVGMVGDAQIGKTSLMVKYVEGSWDEDYIQTLGMQSWLLSLVQERGEIEAREEG